MVVKTISIIYRKNATAQWQVWARTIAASNFKIKIVDPARRPSHTAAELFGDAFLLDGMQPDLAECITYLHGKCPDSRIIVATEVDSFRINYDMLHDNKALYASGPSRADEFAATIQHLVGDEFTAA